MLCSIELSARELGMLKLMADFLAEKPELTTKTDNHATAHYALLTTYTENFGIPNESASEVLEDLKKKVAQAECVHVKMQKEELNMLRVLIDYFSEDQEMMPTGSLPSTRTDILIDAYQQFYGENEVTTEILQNLIEKLRTATFVRIEILAEVAPPQPTPYEAAVRQLDVAAEKLSLSSSIHEILKHPMRTFIVSIPVVMDDGSLRVFTGYRVQYNDVLGPTKGGIRYHPDLTLDDVTGLAACMTWKTAVTGLPLGGGKGGIRCNPKEMSKAELERLTRGFARAIAKFIGPSWDVPAPDVYTDAQTMAWIMDEYSQIVGYPAFGVVTGKPVNVGGSLGRNEATSRGLMYLIIEAAKYLGMDLRNATVAVQGYGNVGYHAARLLHEIGCKIVAVSDSKGGTYNRDGLDPVKVFENKKFNGVVIDYPDGRPISNEQLLKLKCDILVPSAFENQITGANAAGIRAKILAEGANGPTTPEADDILLKKDVFVIPDILANSGGVVVSYFEQVQNQMNFYWTEEEVRARLENTMTRSFNDVLNTAQKYNVSMRTAAYMLAVKRLADALQTRKGTTITPLVTPLVSS